MYFRNAKETDVINSIMRLNKEGGINDVSHNFLVICKNYVSYYLKELLNFCITPGVYPNVFKNAQNTLILKKPSLHNISNYRPVFVLSNLSTVFENFIYNHIEIFCLTSKFLAKNQFGLKKTNYRVGRFNFNG